jgi:hypothetical protein
VFLKIRKNTRTGKKFQIAKHANLNLQLMTALSNGPWREWPHHRFFSACVCDLVPQKRISQLMVHAD